MFIKKFVKGFFQKNKDKVKSNSLLMINYILIFSKNKKQFNKEKCSKIESIEEIKKVIYNTSNLLYFIIR